MESIATDKKHVLPGQYVYEGMTMFDAFPARILDKVKLFGFHDDDVVIATYPKSGTTWMQEIVYLVCNPDKFEIAKNTDLEMRCPFLEVFKPGKKDVIDVLSESKPPRIIKTHLPYNLLEGGLRGKKTKIIVVMRNLKDVLVSYYHFYRACIRYGPFLGSWAEFFDLFKNDELCHGNWFHFNMSMWDIRKQENIYIVKYEDMKENIHEVISHVAMFLGKDLSSEIVERIAEHTSFHSMKINIRVNKTLNRVIDEQVSPFIRKGQVGDWKNRFTVEQDEYVNRMLEKKLSGTGLEFTYQ